MKGCFTNEKEEECLPVNAGDCKKRHGRIAEKSEEEIHTRHLFSLQFKSRIKDHFFPCSRTILHEDVHIVLRPVQDEGVIDFHLHERRHVEGFRMLLDGLVVPAERIDFRISLLPRGVRHFRDDKLQSFVLIKAVIETHGIEAEPEVRRHREHADLSAELFAGMFFDCFRNHYLDGPVNGVNVILPGPGKWKGKRETLVELIEIEIEIADSIAEFVVNRRESPVLNRSGKEATLHTAIPNFSMTFTADFTPSSWKPFPQ